MDFWLDALESRTTATPSPYQSGISSASLHAWDEELELLNRLMRAARVRRNGCSPTAALPPEILAHIFELLSGIQTYDRDERKDWMYTTVSHVCTRWRHIAITTPSLWTYLHPSSRPPWETVITRSGCLPLSVDGPLWDGSRLSRDSQSVLENLPRIRELKLSSTDGDLGFPNSFLAQLSRDNTPQLATLIVTTPSPSHDAPGEVLLLPHLDDLPTRLERVKLSPSLLAWSPFTSASNLRYLELRGQHHHEPVEYIARYLAGVTFIDVLRSLRSMPRLEYLNLDTALPSTQGLDRAALDHEENVALPHLRTFSVRDDAEQSVLLWSKLQLDPLCSVAIICKTLRQPDALKSSLSSYFAATGAVHFLRAKFTTNGQNRHHAILAVELSSTEAPTLYEEQSPSRVHDGPRGFLVPMSTTFYLEIMAIPREAIASVNRQDLLLAIPLVQVTHLTLGMTLSTEIIALLFRRARHTTTLSSTNGFGNQCCANVCRVLSDHTCYQDPEPILPALETLSFAKTGGYDHITGAGFTFEHCMTEVLRWRTLYKCAPQVLQLRECHVSKTYAMRWAENAIVEKYRREDSPSPQRVLSLADHIM